MNRRKKTLFNLKHQLEKIVRYLTCYNMSVKASSQGQKKLFHPLFICLFVLLYVLDLVVEFVL